MIDSKKSRKIPELFFARCELVGGNIELENEFLKTDFIGCQSEFCCSSVTPTGSGARQFQLRSVAQSCGVQDVLPTEKFWHSRVLFSSTYETSHVNSQHIREGCFCLKRLVV